jgi:hypothetical protein
LLVDVKINCPKTTTHSKKETFVPSKPKEEATLNEIQEAINRIFQARAQARNYNDLLKAVKTTLESKAVKKATYDAALDSMTRAGSIVRIGGLFISKDLKDEVLRQGTLSRRRGRGRRT